VFIEAKDDGGGGDNWTTGAISSAKSLRMILGIRSLSILMAIFQVNLG